MKIKLKVVKNEMLYLLYSKIYFILFGLLFAVMFLNVYGQIDSYKKNISEYQKTESYILRQGENIEQVLKQDLNVVQEKSSDGTLITSVDNPLRYENENLGKMLYNLKPTNLSISILEMITFVFGPVIFGLLGILLATYDFKNKTVKIKSLKQSWHVIH